MKLPSITNAVLVKVEGPGFAADYNLDATPGATKWTGTEDVYFSQVSDETHTLEQDQIIKRYIVMSAEAEIDIALNDTVTFVSDGVTSTGTIKRWVTTDGMGLPGVTRITLDDA